MSIEERIQQLEANSGGFDIGDLLEKHFFQRNGQDPISGEPWAENDEELAQFKAHHKWEYDGKPTGIKDDAEFLLRVAAEAQNERSLRKLPYAVATDIILPWLKQFAGLVKHMRSEVIIEEDFGMLNLNSDEVTYTYKNETYQLYSHPYEPCLYLYRGDGLVCVLHNAYNPEQLVKAFSAGETVKTNYGKDYDKEFDEAGFCRVLAAALDSGRDNMDFFDAAKLAKERSQ